MHVSGSVELDGTLTLAAIPDWYAGEWTMQIDSLIDAANQRGEFDAVEFVNTSPTLAFAATALGSQQYRLSANRAADAYSRYASNQNEASAGQALQQFAAQAPAEAAVFYRTLDFSSPDGSQIGRVLAQVGPQAYSAGLSASLMRERDVMEHARRGFSHGLQTSGRSTSSTDWTGYAVAFGGQGRQDGDVAMVGYESDTYGLVVGGGRRLSLNPDISVGLHLDIAEQDSKLKAPQAGKGETTAFGVGAQLQYRADAFEGLYAYSGFRVGVEEGSMKRQLGIADYAATHSADWTGHSASVEGGLGYLRPLNDTIAVGPFMSLNYARVSRPGVSESGPTGTRLELDNVHADALRSSLGLAINARRVMQNDSQFTVGAQISWDHEWLDRDVIQTARFAAAAAPAFDTRNELLPRNSLGLQATIGWQKDHLSIGAGIGGRAGGDYKALEGQVSVRWAF